jgi:hypothetical protein
LRLVYAVLLGSVDKLHRVLVDADREHLLRRPRLAREQADADAAAALRAGDRDRVEHRFELVFAPPSAR